MKKQTNKPKNPSAVEVGRQEPDRDSVVRLLRRGERVHDWFAKGQKSLRCLDDAELRFRYQ